MFAKKDSISGLFWDCKGVGLRPGDRCWIFLQESFEEVTLGHGLVSGRLPFLQYRKGLDRWFGKAGGMIYH